MGVVVGIDVGGTFTDLYYRDEGHNERILKVSSTPSDPSRGLLDALLAANVSPEALDAIVHGTTIATNAVIERRGARCALVTTKGFRDVLELGRRDRPQVFGLSGVQRPLIPRDRRFEVSERIDHRGAVLLPLDEGEVRRLAHELAQRDIECVIIAFINAYADPTHERRAREIFLEAKSDWHLTIATDVLREYYEFERTSTAVVQGFLQPLVTRYAEGLKTKLHERGFAQDILIMQSNGGVASIDELSSRAAHIVRSGPAAGVVAAAKLAADAGFKNVITGDMGGTSFDVAVVIDGVPDIAPMTQLDFRIPLKLPMIDVHTIGAGGGSIASLDRGGVLQVGPRSAGAHPGPVCYGLGGTEPTVTDANLVLGRIASDRPIGGAGNELDIEAARRALGKLGESLGLTAERAADAVLAVVNQSMAGRIRLLSVERGHDPRDFVFVAFGGAGPLHGAALLADVGIKTMLVPVYPGVLCAMGCVLADMRYDFSQTLDQPLVEIDLSILRSVGAAHADAGKSQLHASGVAVDFVETVHHAEMAYFGQLHALKVPIGIDSTREQIEAAFIERYSSEYGRPLGNLPVVFIALRTTVTGIRPAPERAAVSIEGSRQAAPAARRPVYFKQWRDCPIYRRPELRPGDMMEGPAIIEQLDTTIVVEPDMQACVDAHGNILVEG